MFTAAKEALLHAQAEKSFLESLFFSKRSASSVSLAEESAK